MSFFASIKKKIFWYCESCGVHGSIILFESFVEADIIILTTSQHNDLNSKCILRRDSLAFSSKTKTCLKKRNVLSILFESTGNKLQQTTAHII